MCNEFLESIVRVCIILEYLNMLENFLVCKIIILSCYINEYYYKEGNVYRENSRSVERNLFKIYFIRFCYYELVI